DPRGGVPHGCLLHGTARAGPVVESRPTMDADKPTPPEGQPPDKPQPPTEPTSGEPAPAAPGASEAKPAAKRKPIPQELVARLRAGSRNRRPWTAATWIILLIRLAVPAGLIAWIFWPKAPPAPVVLTAYDQVGVRGQRVVCRARLETQDAARSDVDLAGRD